MDQSRTGVDSVEALRRTLIWAASGIGSPAFEEVDEGSLAEAVRLHRLDSRLWHRIQSLGTAAPPQLAAELLARHQLIKAKTSGQIARFAQLREVLRSATGSEEVLPLKGFGLYVLTGREEHLRYSGDVDLLGASPADLVKAALTLADDGYHFHGEEHPYVYAHMTEFEVHARYVITGFPTGEDPADYDPARHREVLRLPRAFTETTVTYGDLADSMNCDGVQATPVPGPEMAMLIRCAHIYVGYAMDPRPLPAATVRLDELAQVRDLARHPSFDVQQFAKICEKFRASLVVGFVRRLCRDLFGADPFEPASGHGGLPEIEHDWFPQNLWWDGIGAGFPVWLGWSPQDLIVRGSAVPSLVQSLGAMRVPVGSDHSARVTLLGARPTEGARYIGLSHREELDFAEVGFTLTRDALRTTVFLPLTPLDQMSGIGVASGDSRVELFFKPREGSAEFSDWSVSRWPPEQLSSSARVDGDRHVLTIELPWTVFGRDRMPERGESVDLLVRARQQVRPWADVTAGLIFPVNLVRAD
ncbi:MAG TPA: nucleotidyltransferase family protein [Trebonia sp.]|nr:nucleotidyltransferase family protein [Trebonia sp.]